MKKVGNHNPNSRKMFLSLAMMLAFSFSSFAQDAAPAAATEAAPAAATTGGDPVKGKALFNSNCAACHKLDAKSTGPALRGVAEKHDMAWIYKWVHNSSDMIKSGDAAAVKLFNENNKAVMTSFPQLSEADIDNIIAYTSEPKAEPAAALPGAQAAAGAADQGGSSNNVILGVLALVLVVLVVMLFMVNNVLRKVAKANGIEVEPKAGRISIWKAFVKNQFLVLVTSIFLLLASGYFVYGFLMQVGVDQDYAPIQPIHYSHKIHAGDNEINCKYCHSAARVSKSAGIPSLNVCMNCHKNITTYEKGPKLYDKEGQEINGSAEIAKLHKYAGFDPKNPNAWDPSKAKPIEWVRIHNLPDHVYFNHSQHTKAGNVQCQTCHGNIPEMDEVKQFSELSMGWCINCHRDTKVDFNYDSTKGNKFYSIYEKFHNDIKAGKMDSVTVKDIGGLECQKCHY